MTALGLRDNKTKAVFRIKTIEIIRYRNVRPNTVLDFEAQPGITVLVGKNGTGKTTLLELIAAVRRLDIGFFAQTEAEIRVVLEGDLKFLELVVVSQKKLNPGHPGLSYPGLEAEPNQVEVKARLSPDNDWTKLDLQPPVGLWQVPQLLGVSDQRLAISEEFLMPRCHRHDEALGVLKSLDEAFLSADTDSAFIYSLGGFVETHRYVEAIPTSARLDIHKMPAMARALVALSLQHISANFTVPKSTASGMLYRKPQILVGRGKNIFSADALSFGEKRLLGIYWLFALPGDVVVIDEPVNGLHYDWIQEVVALLRTRQSFVSSQNPLLLDALSTGDADALIRSLIICELEPGDGPERAFIWRRPTEVEAQTFRRAYDAGFQQVGEILRTQGLW